MLNLLAIIAVYIVIYFIFFPKAFRRAQRNQNLTQLIILLVVFIVSFGTLSFRLFEEGSWLDSLWWSVSTITSVGYGDFYPTTVMGKISGMFVMFGGLIIVAFLTSFILERYKRKVQFKYLSREEQLAILQQRKLEIEKEIEQLIG